MQQVFGPSSLRKSSGVAGFICKTAFKTIPRLGVLSLMLLTVSFYFLFSAGDSFLQIQTEKNTPYELTAMASSSYIESDQLLKIEGVERVSPALHFNAELERSGYLLNAEVTALYSSFPQLQLTEGVIYPDSSNMPYLVLNEAAAKSFSLENSQITVKVNDTVNLNVKVGSCAAVICGIYDDGSDSPAVYMSYDTARRLLGQGNDTQVLLSLSNVGAAPKVVRSLGRYHLTAMYDSSSNMAWDLLWQQAIQSAVSGILIAICAAALMDEKGRREAQQRKIETAALQVCGMTSSETDRILPTRVLFAESVCLIISIAIAMGSGIFSALSAALCIIASIAILFYLTGRNEAVIMRKGAGNGYSKDSSK